MIKYILYKNGPNADIYSMIDDRDKNIFQEFLNDLEEKEKNKMDALVVFLLLTGMIMNDQKYKIIPKSDVVELKTKKYRILTHRIETMKKYKYIILYCFQKPSQKKIQSRYIEKAKRLSREIIAGNALEILGED